MKIDTSLATTAYQQAKTPTIAKASNDEMLRQQTNAFEAILLNFMLDSSLKLESPLYPKEPGSEIYQAMYKESLSNQLAGGFGYSKALFEWLKANSKQA